MSFCSTSEEHSNADIFYVFWKKRNIFLLQENFSCCCCVLEWKWTPGKKESLTWPSSKLFFPALDVDVQCVNWTSKRKPGNEPTHRTLEVLKGRSSEVQLLPTALAHRLWCWMRLLILLSFSAVKIPLSLAPLSWYLTMFIVEMFLLVFSQNFLCYLCLLPWPFPKLLWEDSGSVFAAASQCVGEESSWITLCLLFWG